MSILMTVTFEASEGNRDRLADRLVEILPDTERFDGCEGVRLGESPGSPGSFVLVEHWRSVEAYDAYKRWRVESGTTVLGSDLVAGPAVVTTYDPITF